jgi:hypothetical protein
VFDDPCLWSWAGWAGAGLGRPALLRELATRRDVEALTVEGSALSRALRDGSGNSNGNGKAENVPRLRPNPVAET